MTKEIDSRNEKRKKSIRGVKILLVLNEKVRHGT